MFLLVLFAGFFSYTLSVDRQYVFVNESKTWAEAQRYCREKYTDLATIENQQQTVQLIDTINDGSIDLAWIGLYDDLDSWKWTLEDSDFFKTGEKNFRNWNNPGPDNSGGHRLCVLMSSGIWQTTGCSGSYYRAICYDGRENASATYVVVNQYQTWTEAQSYCREHHTDLVSIRSKTENNKMQYLLQTFLLYETWIGLYRTRSWSDHSNSSFTYWKTGHPNTAEFCTVASFSDSGKWEDKYCNNVFTFFCYSTLSSSRQYHFVNESKTWTEAQRYCRQNYTDLATIDNMEEMNRLINTVNGSYSGSAWIGLYDDVNSWRWSLEDNDFYQEGERDFRNWRHEPDNSGGNDLCVYMDYDGKWFDMSCGFGAMNYICYDGRENATQSYIKINDWKNWTEARRYCRDHYTDLVNVRNQTENQRIFEATGGRVWIGLYRNRIWSDHQFSSYQNWRPYTFDSVGQPDNGEGYAQTAVEKRGFQHCTAVSFSHSGQWTDEVCVSSMPFFCYSRNCTQSSCARQYHFLSESKTWAEAQSYCRHNYTDLATIDNMEEMNRLIKTVRGTYYGSAWIGLYDDLNSWRWSLDNTALDGSYKRWYVSQPLNSGGQNLCAYLSNSQGIWSETSCSSRLPFVCYDGRANASTNYVFLYLSNTWTEAQKYCREHYTDLVSIRNKAENYRVQTLLSYYSVVWIGLYRTRSWSDQSNSSFSNWRTGQPDNAGYSEYCTAVSFSDSGSWTDENCNTALPFICYSGLASSRQYHFLSKNKTWTEAQRYCRQNYTDLATIDNMEEMNRLINTVNGSYNGSAWIGLYDDVNSWRWSLEDNDFYQEGERDFRNWYHAPDNRGGNEMCVVMNGDGKWSDLPCDNYFTFVCYDDRVNASEKYVLVRDSRTWTAAQSYCKEKHTDLASVRNEAEYQHILNITSGCVYGNCYVYTVWICLYRNRLWSDQSSSSFTYWLPGAPVDYEQPDNGLNALGMFGSQHCTAVSLKKFGQWSDESCFVSLPFFCYSAFRPKFSDEYVMGMQVKVTSLESLSHSQIEELVIIQLQEQLVRLGLPNNVTMHLRGYRKINP
ncbi:lymphocyte antigen 75-like [Labeo rohita]|uniref:lymphocyte antigen 75-like n=1 Tax=Labeo rohita TaxID=84645 RepID=UPI0021E2281A|nr:lymphocyte antigen 75-like [Labeo rohita]